MDFSISVAIFLQTSGQNAALSVDNKPKTDVWNSRKAALFQNSLKYDEIHAVFDFSWKNTNCLFRIEMIIEMCLKSWNLE